MFVARRFVQAICLLQLYLQSRLTRNANLFALRVSCDYKKTCGKSSLNVIEGVLGMCLYEYGGRRKECVANLVTSLYGNNRGQTSGNINPMNSPIAEERRETRKPRKTYAGNPSQQAAKEDSILCRKQEFGFPPGTSASLVDMATNMLCALCQVQTDDKCVEIWCYIHTQ